MKQTPGLNNLTGKPEKDMCAHIQYLHCTNMCFQTYMRSLNDLAWQKGNAPSHFLVLKQWQLGLTGLAGFAGSVLLKIGCLLLCLFSKLSTFRLSSHLQSDGHWSCLCENMDAVTVDVTLKLMSARVHPSWREKLPEESCLNTLWCRKHHTSLMPLRQAFRYPTGHLVAKRMLALTSSNLFLQLIFLKASCSIKKNKWPLNGTSHFSTYSPIVELPRDCFLYLPLLVTQQSADTCISNKIFNLYSDWRHMYFVFGKYHLHCLEISNVIFKPTQNLTHLANSNKNVHNSIVKHAVKSISVAQTAEYHTRNCKVIGLNT